MTKNYGSSGDVYSSCVKCNGYLWGPRPKKGSKFVCNNCIASRKAACLSVGSVPKPPSAHYAKLAIDPYEYAHRNGLGMLQGNVVKYVTRYKDKNGKEDLEKAMNTLKRLIEMEYPE